MNATIKTSMRSIAALLLIAATAALLVTLLDGRGTSRSQAAAAGEPIPALAQAAAGRETARAHVAALRRPRSATRDALPTAVLAGPLLSDGALDAATARKVATDGGSGWVASSGDGQSVCAVVDGALGCTTLSSLLGDGAAPSIMGRLGEPHQVFGVAADGVREIELVHQDDSTEPVAITDGFYLVASDEMPKALTWTGPDGPASFAFPPH